MSLSQCCYNIHQELKAFNADLKRSHVYELIAYQLGFKSYKFLCQDGIVLCDVHSKWHLSTDINDLLLKIRYKKLDVNIPLDVCHSVINKHLEQSEIGVFTLKELYAHFLPTQKMTFDEWKNSQILQNLFGLLSEKNTQLDLVLLNILILQEIKSKYYQASPHLLKKYEAGEDISNSHFYKDVVAHYEDKKFQQQLTIAFEYLKENFDKQEILPYLTIFLMCDDKDYLQAVFYDEYEIRDKISGLSENNPQNADNFLEIYTWHYFALELGFDDILEGEPYRAYAVNSSGETIYDDWEFGDFAGVVETGYDEIILPNADSKIKTEAKKLAQQKYHNRIKFHEIYEKIDNVKQSSQDYDEDWDLIESDWCEYNVRYKEFYQDFMYDDFE